MSTETTVLAAGPTEAAAPEPAAAPQPRHSRAERNRNNARHSTGPRTHDGKRRSSLNAFRHGLTAQTTLLPTEDAAAFAKFHADQFAALQPVGGDEAAFAQAIVDFRWQLSRAQSIENNLLYLLPASDAGNQPRGHHQPALDNAAATALAFFENIRQFDLIGRYVARLSRLIIQNHDELKALQYLRAEAKREAEQEQRDAEQQQRELAQQQLIRAKLNAPIDWTREGHSLPPKVRERLIAMQLANQQSGQSNEAPAADSGFVSQRGPDADKERNS